MAPRRRRILSAAALSFFALWSNFVAAAAVLPSLEYAVKATFLYKFAPFVEWPDGSFGSASSPLVICVVGNDPVGGMIDQVALGQRIGERAIEVRHLQSVGRQSGCHILYIAQPDAPSAMQAANAVRGTPVLTVSDMARGAGAPCIVRFVVQNNKVTFDIDNAAAAESQLAISSRLLSLARSVRPKP